jgi:hypothetical protein
MELIEEYIHTHTHTHTMFFPLTNTECFVVIYRSMIERYCHTEAVSFATS